MSGQRHAARSLHRDVEAVWERLRAEFVLRDGFWLAFLFGAQVPDVAELAVRTGDQARPQVKHVVTLTLTEQAGEAAVLGQLLTPHPAGLAATWVLDNVAVTADRVRLWSRLLRRLNERRDALASAHPAALLLVCPAGAMPLVRDTAPDLWSVRSLTATLETAPDAAAAVPTPPDAPVPGRIEFTPVPGEPIQPSPEVGVLLRQAASALRSGRTDLAVEAARHARIALQGRRPLELDTTVALLKILSGSLDPGIALDATTALVELRRELVQRLPDSPAALRNLSVSLNEVGSIQEQQGRLDGALAAYTESLNLTRRILTDYDETPQSLRDLTIYLNNVAGIQKQHDQPDD